MIKEWWCWLFHSRYINNAIRRWEVKWEDYADCRVQRWEYYCSKCGKWRDK
jgi:hypothetical protein